MIEFNICSECFCDEGLRLDAQDIGILNYSICKNCGSTNGQKLDTGLLTELAYRFFVWGTLKHCNYGAAPLIQFNQLQKTSITVPRRLEADIGLIEHNLDVGFFHYGPRLWMIGEVEPLKALNDPASSNAIIKRIIQEYPGYVLRPNDTFYRIRNAPNSPSQPHEYDSQPFALAGKGRLDSQGFPVMYASPDLQLCIHECRVTADDNLYVATLTPFTSLRLLDLSALLKNEDTTEFESLDMAVHMLFLAGKHSYPIARKISLAAHNAGFDGLVFPSYFSLLRQGLPPFETIYGISNRRIPRLQDHEEAKHLPNFAIFGCPIEESKIKVQCINKLILRRVEYDFHFGPVGIV